MAAQRRQHRRCHGSTYTLGDADVGTNIRVVVSYTDGNGTAESLTSATVGPVANVNDAPTGAPVVTGTPTEDQTLTADTTTIADADGLGAFSYQWQRNGVNIAGATGSTYTLGDADVGTNIRVVVSYTDGNGTAESLSSAAVGPIANVNDAPTGAPLVTGTATEDQTLTADTSAIADADGLGAFSYQWQRDGVNIVGATGSTYTLDDADVGTNIRVIVSYIDGQGTAESLTSAAVGPVANVNDAPVLTSNGGGASANITAAENQTAVTTVTSTDVDGGTAVYSIIGGADAALFTIDSATGVLTFVTAPDFESPADAGGNNVYDVTVQVADGNGGFDTQAIAITVTNVNEAPVITSNGGGAVASVNVAENQFAVTVVAARDVDGDVVRYSIVGGADAARFAIDAASGALRFVTAPDFEAPTDVNRDNVYDLVVGVADGNGGIDTQVIAVAVTNVNEAPGNIAPAAATLAENASAGTVVAIVTASDPDAGDLFTFTLVNDGNGRFVIDPSSGRLTVAPGAVLDFETEPSQTLLLRVTDAQGLRTEQSIVVTLNDVYEPPPVAVAPGATPTPAPALGPAPAPAPEALPQPPAAAEEHDRESANSRRTSALVALGELVDFARGGAELQADEDHAAQTRDGRRQRGDAPVIVASVSFEFDELLSRLQGDGQGQRFGLFSLRGSAVDTDPIDDGSAARNRSPEQALAAAVQDPVRVASATLTAGFVWWLTRSGGLLTSILMGIPAWRHVDLLPVLAPARDDEDDDGLGGGRDDADRRDDETDSVVDGMFSNTSRFLDESRFTP